VQLGEECDASSADARNRRAVAEDEPPALAALIRGNLGEHVFGRLVLEREQRELLAAVEPGDEPRRPAAEPSPARVEQHRTSGARVGTHL
jgi:hypothetical protein